MGIKTKEMYTCFCDICDYQYEYHGISYFHTTEDMFDALMTADWEEKRDKWYCCDCLNEADIKRLRCNVSEEILTMIGGLDES